MRQILPLARTARDLELYPVGFSWSSESGEFQWSCRSTWR